MQELDYIIVGQGLAGSCFALTLLQQNKSFVIIDSPKKCASRIAAGVYNPVVLKRFAPVWDAENQLRQLHETFGQFETLLGKKYIIQMPVVRLFQNENENQIWLKKVNNLTIKSYLYPDFIANDHPKIKAYFGYGMVKQTGRIALAELLMDFADYLTKNKQLINQKFSCDELIVSDIGVIYKQFKAKKIVFCEGFGLKNNPYFNHLPLIANKGEVIIISTKESLPEFIFNAKTQIVPFGNNEYYVGATYERDDQTYNTTLEATAKLETAFEAISNIPFEIKTQKASIRPTVVDRRPLVGVHRIYHSLAVLNGMGTRGTMLAPVMALALYNHLENNQLLDMAIDIKRFH